MSLIMDLKLQDVMHLCCYNIFGNSCLWMDGWIHLFNTTIFYVQRILVILIDKNLSIYFIFDDNLFRMKSFLSSEIEEKYKKKIWINGLTSRSGRLNFDITMFGTLIVKT